MNNYEAVLQIENGGNYISVENSADNQSCLLLVGKEAALLTPDEVTALIDQLQGYLASRQSTALTVPVPDPTPEGSTYTPEQLQKLYLNALKEILADHPKGSAKAIPRWQILVNDEETSLIVPYSHKEPGGIWTEKVHKIALY